MTLNHHLQSSNNGCSSGALLSLKHTIMCTSAHVIHTHVWNEPWFALSKYFPWCWLPASDHNHKLVQSWRNSTWKSDALISIMRKCLKHSNSSSAFLLRCCTCSSPTIKNALRCYICFIRIKLVTLNCLIITQLTVFAVTAYNAALFHGLVRFNSLKCEESTA